MRPRIFVDSGAFVALRRPRDSHHIAAVRTLTELAQRGVELVSTNYTFSETYTTLLSRVGRRIAINWGSDMRAGAGIEFVRVSEEVEDAAWKILASHEDKHWSYVDAVSFALMEREGIGVAFAFDDHFRQRGLATIPTAPA